MGDATILFDDMISILNQRGAYYLYQASCEPQPGMICSNWFTSDDLELEGPTTLEWKTFRCVIINFGVNLQARLYVLKWMGGNSSGQITVKNVYEATEEKI